MVTILYLAAQRPDETTGSYISGILDSTAAVCFSSFKKYSSGNNLLEPQVQQTGIKKIWPFSSAGKNSNAAWQDAARKSDWIVTMDFASFTRVARLKLNEKHLHIVCYPFADHVKGLLKQPPARVIVPCDTVKRELNKLGVSNELLRVIPPPVNFIDGPQPAAPRQSFVVGSINPLIPGQGIETIIQSLHETQEILPQLKLIVVGDGPEKKRLQWLIAQLHLQTKIQIVSQTERYERFIANFDVLIAPQHQAPIWNTSISHAFAQGVPVIASKTGCHIDLIEHGKTGLLFEPGNSSVLTQHLINLYNNPDWVEHYKKAGREKIENWYGEATFIESLLKDKV